jgi:hypothetical protein
MSASSTTPGVLSYRLRHEPRKGSPATPTPPGSHAYTLGVQVLLWGIRRPAMPGRAGRWVSLGAAGLNAFRLHTASGLDQEKPPSTERLAAIPTATLKGLTLRMSACGALKYASLPSELNATPGSLTLAVRPPVHADKPGTRIREKLRPPSRDAITRSVEAPS